MEFLIKSNINKDNKVHDLFELESIESQVLKLLRKNFKSKVEYSIGSKGNHFVRIGSCLCSLEIKKTVKIEFIDTKDFGYYFESNHFSIYDSGDYSLKKPKVSLSYNKDESKKFSKFASQIDDINSNYEKAELLKPRLDDIDFDSIEKYLSSKLKVKGWEIRMSSKRMGDLFSGEYFVFYLKPIDGAPADGLFLCLECNGRLSLFWDGSTKRRTHSYQEDVADVVEEEILNKLNRVIRGSSLEETSEKIRIATEMKKKIENFSHEGSSEIVKFFKLIEEANKLAIK